MQALMKPCKKLPFAIENGFNGRLGLLRRSAPGAGVAWFDLGRPVGWAAHVGNAWEDADGSRVHIVITQCAAPYAFASYVYIPQNGSQSVGRETQIGPWIAESDCQSLALSTVYMG